MIAAVQVESNALDAMRERLKELDSMKSQLTSLTRRLLDADQSNLTLKSNMIKLNDSFTDLKRSKAEVGLYCGSVCVRVRVWTNHFNKTNLFDLVSLSRLFHPCDKN